MPASTPAILFFGHQAQAQLFGAERSLLTLLDRAAGAGLRVELVLPHCLNPAYLEQARARSHRVHLLPYGWRRNGFAPHPATLAAMVALIRASGAVEVHQNTIVLDAPLIAARQAGVASVVHLRELPAEDAGICAALGIGPDDLRRALIAGADRFVANSTAVADWIDPQREMPGRVLILPNRVDPALSALPFAPGNPVRVGLISSNTCKKGIGDVVAVARAFLANPALVPVEFLLIGPDSADLRALHPLPAGLRQTGYAPSPAEAMAQVDVVLSLSHFAESFGRTVLEALEAGRPVICYDRGTPPKLLRDDAETVLAGAVVPADDPAAVADALRDLLASPDRLADAAQAARARAGVLRNRDTLPDHALFVRAFAAGGSPSDP